MKAKGLSVRPLVSGHAIRWNTDHDWQSQEYNARDVSIFMRDVIEVTHLLTFLICTWVIDQIINDDLEKYHSTNRRLAANVKKVDYFHDINFNGGDWEDINALNQALLVRIPHSKFQSL